MQAACGANEIMISAYCTGEGSTLHINKTIGASCEGSQSNTVVVVCAER